MNIHLPAILMFTRGTIGFDTLPYWTMIFKVLFWAGRWLLQRCHYRSLLPSASPQDVILLGNLQETMGRPMKIMGCSCKFLLNQSIDDIYLVLRILDNNYPFFNGEINRDHQINGHKLDFNINKYPGITNSSDSTSLTASSVAWRWPWGFNGFNPPAGIIKSIHKLGYGAPITMILYSISFTRKKCFAAAPSSQFPARHGLHLAGS